MLKRNTLILTLACVATSVWAQTAASASKPAAAQAQTLPSAPVTVSQAWARSTVAQQTVSAAYMQLQAMQAGWSVVAAHSPAAGRMELHDMRMEGDVMRMFAIEQLPLPVGEVVRMQPGGKHWMLLNLPQALAAGTEISLTLELLHRDGRRAQHTVSVPVRGLAPSGQSGAAQPMSHGAGHGAHHGH